MPLFRKTKDSAEKPPRDGPEEWAAKAREVDEEEKERRAEEQRRKMAEPAGDVAIGSYSGEKVLPNVVNELSPDFLKFMLNELHAEMGKFLRVDDLILVGPAEWGRDGTLKQKLGHDQFFEVLKQADPELQARLANAQTVVKLRDGALEDPHGKKNEDGVEDGGYFLLEPAERGQEITSLKIGGRSGAYGMADLTGRAETLRLVQETLGPKVRIEEKFIY